MDATLKELDYSEVVRFLRQRREPTFSIVHFSFFIFHLGRRVTRTISPYPPGQMENGKWKMAVQVVGRERGEKIMPGHFEISIETQFCAAHALREYKGIQEPTHGHNFKVIATVRGEKVDRSGMAIDFLELKPVVESEVGRLHYGFINEAVSEFRADGGNLSPSAENIAVVLYQRIAKRLPAGVAMSSVQVFESPGCSATYREI